MPRPLTGARSARVPARRPVRRLLALVLVLPALLLAGCQDEPEPEASAPEVVTSDIADVEVTGEPGEKPTVSYDGTFEAASTERLVLEEGTGPEVQLGQKVSLNYLGVNGRDGMEFDTSFDNPAPASFVLEEGQLIDGFITALEGVKAGSRVVVGITPDDGYGPAGGQPDAGIEAEDSLIFVIDVLSSTDVLERAAGTTQEPLAGLPTVALAEDGTPTVTVPAGPPPTEPLFQKLIVGEGDTIELGQTLTVHYVLQQWSDGEVLESSWAKGAPVPLPLVQGQVMPTLIANLEGVAVGSQVMLVVPPDAASEGAAEPVTDTLVFVFDILDAE